MNLENSNPHERKKWRLYLEKLGDELDPYEQPLSPEHLKILDELGVNHQDPFSLTNDLLRLMDKLNEFENLH